MHCISIYLINKSEIRDEKIENLFCKITKNKSIKWVDMGQLVATTNIPNIRDWGKDKTIAKIETDYFGGAGSQSAKLFINNKKVYDKNDEFGWKEKPINSVLKMMGITPKDGMDEFDTIGLSKYRSNEDFDK